MNHSSNATSSLVKTEQKMEVSPGEIKKEKVKHSSHTSASEDDLPLVSEVSTSVITTN